MGDMAPDPEEQTTASTSDDTVDEAAFAALADVYEDDGDG